MPKQAKIVLSEPQPQPLQPLISPGQPKAQVMRNAHLILKSGAGWAGLGRREDWAELLSELAAKSTAPPNQL